MNKKDNEQIKGTLTRRIVIDRVGGNVIEHGVRISINSSEIDEEGIVDKTVNEYGVCDCGCVIKDPSEIGGVCGCGKLLCKNHFYHCERCGKGMCAEEKRELKGKTYCKHCYRIALLKTFIGLEP